VCDVKLDGTAITPINTVSRNIEILTCVKCKEVFEIHWWEDCDIDSFVFSCKDIAVLCVYDGQYAGFHIGNIKNLWPSRHTQDDSIDIPFFEIDFSYKKILHEKLKTYLVFS
jgi:hypothetical protein